MKVRLATQHDIPPLMAMLRRVVPLMLAEGNLQWDESYPNELVFQEDIARSQLWVAELEERIAGVAALTSDPEADYAQAGLDPDEPAIIVHRLAVDPAARGAGVATVLMNQAERIARERGIATLRVDTSTQNEATQRLFPKLGYRLAGEISLQLHANIRVFCYEKRLLAP